MNTGRITETIIEQTELVAGIFSMWIRTELALSAKPGQFLQIFTPNASKLLARPISICEINREEQRLRIVYRVNGVQSGTYTLSQLQSGDTVDVMGPFGNGFPVELARDKQVALIGGGIGIPPLLEVAKGLPHSTSIMGYASEVFLTHELSQVSNLHISTEDGSVGTTGYVTDILYDNNVFLKKLDLIFACGPKAMLEAVAEYAQIHGIPCYVSMEERMACGIGACLACVCATKEVNEHTNVKNVRVCKEGPVFLSTEIVW